MPKRTRRLLPVFLCMALVTLCLTLKALSAQTSSTVDVRDVETGKQGMVTSGLSITYPLPDTVFPRDFPPPAFLWKDGSSAVAWNVRVTASSSEPFISEQVATTSWRPSIAQWEQWKAAFPEVKVTVSITAQTVSPAIESTDTRSVGSVGVIVSADAVEAPIFFRAVPLPFIEALRHMDQISWRLGVVATTTTPRVVLDRMVVCGNCHSFSNDGRVIGMDVDYANDKGSYLVASVASIIEMTRDKIITWSDFRREDQTQTFGLLSQVSPDGRHVVSTVKDRSIFLPRNDPMFSQIFFPFRGILAVYSRDTATFTALPGADDPNFVQSSPAWSPDGKKIIFARAPVDPAFGTVMQDKSAVLSGAEGETFMARGIKIRYDLYEVSFNDGKGGTARPLEGASNNGFSNYFPRYSPDGRWIVFCRASSYMLLQPDSELWIIPATGGKARRMTCNTSRMNSWHSFSPNGRWLVFASKWQGPATRLYLTHIDENGMDTPPVWLESFDIDDRAANIPEFANIAPHSLQKMSEQFVDENSFVRMARQFYFIFSDSKLARRELEQAMKKNPRLAQTLQEPVGHLLSLSEMLAMTGYAGEAIRVLERVVEQEPTHPEGYANLGILYEQEERLPEAQACFEKAVQLDPKSPQLRNYLGMVYLRRHQLSEALRTFDEARLLDPTDAVTRTLLGTVCRQLKDNARAEIEYREAVKLSPKDAVACVGLGRLLCESKGAWEEGIQWVETARQLVPLPKEERLFLGNAYLRVGRISDALQIFEELAREQPDDQNLQKAIEDIRKRLK